MNTEAIQATMKVIGGKWKAQALIHLKTGPTRFNALKRRLPGVTQRMLSQQLRELEADGIVSRKVLEVVPPHVEYALTPRGATLVPILNWLSEWGEAVAEPQPAPDPLAAPRQARSTPASVQEGGLTATFGGARLSFGAASLTEADA
jgi:DNA-binding HxlR family transcriptional regulator